MDVKKYQSFLKHIFCFKIKTTSGGIAVSAAEDYEMSWDEAEGFFDDTLIEYNATFLKF